MSESMERIHSLPKAFVCPAELSGVAKDAPILVAYSGGADSTALLYMLREYGKQTGAPIYAAHVNHGIRGAEADTDEAFCRRVAEEWKIPLFVHRANIPQLAKETGESIETAARQARYAFFDEIMKANGIPLLATAHNADDNLETMLFHLVRGSGLGGMCGIPISRSCEYGTLIRPILSMTKEQLLTFCEEHDLSFVTDSTNTDVEYTRNKIRAEILPSLRAINPAAAEHASHLAESLRADDLCLQSMANWFLEEMRDGYAIECEKLNGSPSAIVSRALIALFREFSEGKTLSFSHVTALRELSRKSIPHSTLSLPAGTEAVIENGRLLFRKQQKPTPPIPYEIPLFEGKTKISQTNCEIIMKNSQSSKNIYKNSILLSLDSATINGSLYARGRAAGDRIRMGGVRKSLKKLMCEKKIPLSLRSRLPVICDEDGIVAVPLVGTRDGMSPKENTAEITSLYVFL